MAMNYSDDLDSLERPLVGVWMGLVKDQVDPLDQYPC